RVRAVLRLKPGVTFRIVTMDTTLARVPVGQLLDGRYRVEAHLAHGGMATVYLGTDTRLDRTVALKIMHAELANDEDFVRRFVSEARSVARLSHPNVVTVYDQGADGRTLYLAMENVPGQTLRGLLDSRGGLGAGHHGRGAGRARRRPRRRYRAPRRQARERAAHRLHGGQGRRFRAGQAGDRDEPDQDRDDHRHRRVPGSRAGSRAGGRRAH